jgi:hypothetical protein
MADGVVPRITRRAARVRGYRRRGDSGGLRLRTGSQVLPRLRDWPHDSHYDCSVVPPCNAFAAPGLVMRFRSRDARRPISTLAEACAEVCPQALFPGKRAAPDADAPEFNTASKQLGRVRKHRARRSWPGILSREIIQYP